MNMKELEEKVLASSASQAKDILYFAINCLEEAYTHKMDIIYKSTNDGKPELALSFIRIINTKLAESHDEFLTELVNHSVLTPEQKLEIENDKGD